MPYSKRQLMDTFHINLITVRKTLAAIGVSTKPTRISDEQAQQFSLARWLIEVEGKTLNEIREIFEAGVELDSSYGTLSIAREIAQAKQGLTVADLALVFNLSDSTVRRTLQQLGLASHRYFQTEDVNRFARARETFTNDLGSTNHPKASRRQRISRDFNATKKQLAREYGLTLLTVRRTLEVAGISTTKQRYSDLEVQRFQLARKLIDAGWQYKQVAQHLKANIEPGGSSTNN